MPSLFDFWALVALFIFILGAIRMANLELRINALGNALEAASVSTVKDAIITALRGELEALRGAYKTSEDTILGLRATISQLHITTGHIQGLAHPCNHSDDFAAMERNILDLQQQLAVVESELERSKAACAGKSARIYDLIAAQQAQVDATDVEHAKVVRLERTIRDQSTTLWQLNVVRGQFDHVKELIHQLVAAGGLQMVVTVLFVALLARFGGVDLAELGIDHLRFESYFEYAKAMMDGLPCPLLPQDGFRLEGIQYPLSGLRVVGSRIVGPFVPSLHGGSVVPVPAPMVSSAPLPVPASLPVDLSHSTVPPPPPAAPLKSSRPATPPAPVDLPAPAPAPAPRPFDFSRPRTPPAPATSAPPPPPPPAPVSSAPLPSTAEAVQTLSRRASASITRPRKHARNLSTRALAAAADVATASSAGEASAPSQPAKK